MTNKELAKEKGNIRKIRKNDILQVNDTNQKLIEQKEGMVGKENIISSSVSRNKTSW